jgi:hypothetical protein
MKIVCGRHLTWNVATFLVFIKLEQVVGEADERTCSRQADRYMSISSETDVMRKHSGTFLKMTICKWKWRLGPSQWPRGLRHRSAASRLLGLRVRIWPEAWMFVLFVLYKDSSMEHKVTWRRTEGFKITKWIKRKKWDRKKKSRRRHGGLFLVNVVCCAGTGLCDRPIPHPEESCLVCICHRVWSGATVTRYTSGSQTFSVHRPLGSIYTPTAPPTFFKKHKCAFVFTFVFKKSFKQNYNS